MADDMTLKLLDELDKTTRDFLSELDDMESKRGRTSSKKVVIGRTEEVAPAPKQGTPRPVAPPADAEEYSMKHPRRGQCLIFVYKNYLDLKFSARSSAIDDSELCKEAFEALNFEVEVFVNLKTKDLNAELEKASTQDHSTCDCLAVVFMSHGFRSSGTREELKTYDGAINTAQLWEHLAYSPTLQGKPKLFFIQACRGQRLEPSVGLKVSTDSMPTPQDPPEWALGFNSPDMLVMLSSYEDMKSFRSKGAKINGSVFIHFLALVLRSKTGPRDLSELLFEVSRRVAIDYETGPTYDYSKQMPQTRSTLTKKIIL